MLPTAWSLLEHSCPVSQLYPTLCCMATQEWNTSYSSQARMHLGISWLGRLLFFVIFLHLPTLPFNSTSPSQPVHLLALSCYYFLICSVRNCWSLREVLNCWSFREVGWGHKVRGCQRDKPDVLSVQTEHTSLWWRKGHKHGFVITVLGLFWVCFFKKLFLSSFPHLFTQTQLKSLSHEKLNS